MMDKFKDLYKLQKQAKDIKKKLKNIHIESDHEGIVVVITGEQEIVEVRISDEAKASSKLEENLVKCFNKAVKKAQQIAADMMKDVMGGMPGLGA
jgi:DNA-binding protein YbaB